MARVKGALATRKRRKKTLKLDNVKMVVLDEVMQLCLYRPQAEES